MQDNKIYPGSHLRQNPAPPLWSRDPATNRESFVFNEPLPYRNTSSDFFSRSLSIAPAGSTTTSRLDENDERANNIEKRIMDVGMIVEGEAIATIQFAQSGVSFRCSKSALTSESGFFRACFAHGLKESHNDLVTLHDDDPKIMRHLLLLILGLETMDNLSTFLLRTPIGDKLCGVATQGLMRQSPHQVLRATLLAIVVCADKYCYAMVRHNGLKELANNSKGVSSVDDVVKFYFNVIDALGEYPEELYEVVGKVARRGYRYGVQHWSLGMTSINEIVLEDKRLGDWIKKEVTGRKRRSDHDGGLERDDLKKRKRRH
ncbi:uncharacterized protein HMPREF1541_10185 [Cyphellophora europaea CBS 101466]|uniref:BTB domain-containing protein n=1 Tax=Cyphellophora europaea (strain CBS 101466) TaxID=1220924 RepID=W2S7B5_CYPE1|nr:uncharacterized protein HMPREF1541_10185 [Cyphellophora europaea CBS 101466]ETN44515.1 hypothetical protein HMPREF1541_10185 [Cyphellophora europaea CBS 101466]